MCVCVCVCVCGVCTLDPVYIGGNSRPGIYWCTERLYPLILYVTIQDALDVLCGKVESLRKKWDSESQLIEQKTEQILLEFGTSV